MQLLAGLLLVVAGCLAGCTQSAAKWKLNKAQMGTQFQVKWESGLAIGFPGTLDGEAEGRGEQKRDNAITPPATPPPTP